MNEPNPPARISTARAEMLATAKAINAGINDRDRLNLDDVFALGKIILDLTKDCDHGQKEKVYEEIGVSRQRAHTCMRIAQMPAKERQKCQSIAAAIRRCDELDKEKSQMSSAGHLQNHAAPQVAPTKNPAPASGTAEVRAALTPAPSLFCGRCKARGPVKGCHDCLRLRGKPIPEREPGDDTEQIAADKRAVREHNRTNGKELFNSYVWTTKVGELGRMLDDIRKEMGFSKENKVGAPTVVETPEHKKVWSMISEAVGLVEKIAAEIAKLRKEK